MNIKGYITVKIDEVDIQQAIIATPYLENENEITVHAAAAMETPGYQKMSRTLDQFGYRLVLDDKINKRYGGMEITFIIKKNLHPILAA